MSDQTTTKTYSVEEIRERIVSDPCWTMRGIVAIFRYQTEVEKATETTNTLNGVGFSGADAEILSSFAKQIIRNSHVRGYTLSPKQLAIAQKKIKKYAGQLHRIATAKQ